MNKPKIYTHDEATRILELFEETLHQYDIVVPSPEDDDREEDNAAALYGSTYSDLFDAIENTLIELLNKAQDAEIVPYEYSGSY